jgi:hypothetical protein
MQLLAEEARIVGGRNVSPLLSLQSARNYARLAGILGIFSFLGGGLGEAYVPSVIIVSGDAAATTRNLVSSELLYRVGFAGYLIEAIADVGLTWSFYVLLQPVQRPLALLSVFFRLIATGGFAMSQALRFSALPIALGGGDLETFSAAQRESLALLSINAGGIGLELFSMFYGLGAIILGYLIYRSNYLPWILGALLAFSGIAFVGKAFATVLAPAYSSPLLLAPVGIAWLALTVWLLVKGIDGQKWQQMNAKA